MENKLSLHDEGHADLLVKKKKERERIVGKKKINEKHEIVRSFESSQNRGNRVFSAVSFILCSDLHAPL